MKCSKCGAENPEDANFCENCGAALQKQTLEERFSDISLKASNTLRWKGPVRSVFFWIYWFLLPFWIFGLIGLSVNTVPDFGYVVNGYEVSLEEKIILWVMLLALLLALTLLTLATIKVVKMFPPKSIERQLQVLSDGIEDYQPKYVGFLRFKPCPTIFLKDNKLGLLDVANYCVLLPATYDYLSWKEEGLFLTAVKDGVESVIDIYGKKVAL